MVRTFFLGSLILGIASLGWAAFIIDELISSTDPASGNAGAFSVFLSFGVGGIGIGLSGIFGVFGVSVKYLYPEKLPSDALYSYWWPALLLAPGGLLLLALTSQVLSSGF